MKVAMVGATKGMGRALARRMAERGDALMLLGRNSDELARSAADLEARGAEHPVSHAHCDLELPETFEAALEEAWTALAPVPVGRGQGHVDAVVVTAGVFGTQTELEDDPLLAQRLLTVNFTNTVLFCELARKKLLAQGGGTLCVFSSVAGERGRKPVVLYGASKAGLTRYLEGLDHRYRSQGLRVVTVKPGFVRTSMTEGLRAPPLAATPDQVATRILSAIDGAKPVVYAPLAWRFVMGVIRHLPRAVMRRVEF